MEKKKKVADKKKSNGDLEKDSKLAPLPKDFYSTDVVTLARELIGKIIVRKLADGKEIKVFEKGNFAI